MSVVIRSSRVLTLLHVRGHDLHRIGLNREVLHLDRLAIAEVDRVAGSHTGVAGRRLTGLVLAEHDLGNLAQNREIR